MISREVVVMFWVDAVALDMFLTNSVPEQTWPDGFMRLWFHSTTHQFYSWWVRGVIYANA